jgi:hypothetical protein
MGQPERAGERLEKALDMAEGLWLPEVLSHALNSKGALVLLGSKGRPEEGFALLRHALHLAQEHDFPNTAMRAYYNLSNLLYYHDRYDAALPYVHEGLAMARRLGYRNWEWPFLAELTFVLFMKGEWDEALERVEEVPYREESSNARFAVVEVLQAIPTLHTFRGELDEAREMLEPFAVFGDSADLQERASYVGARAMISRAEGHLEETIAQAEIALEARHTLGPIYPEDGAVRSGRGGVRPRHPGQGEESALDHRRSCCGRHDSLPAGTAAAVRGPARGRRRRARGGRARVQGGGEAVP